MHAKRCLGVLAGIAMLPAAVVAQSNFEGVVSYTMSTAMGMSMDVTTYVKGELVRQEINMNMGGMGPMVAITDTKAGVTRLLQPAMKTYTVMDMSKMMPGQEDPDAQIETTDRSETIAGHSCKHVLIHTTNNGNKADMDVCTTGDLGVFLGSSVGGGRQGGAMMGEKLRAELRKRFANGYFPLKTTLSVGGNEVMTMTATKVEKKSVNADLFKVPADYKETGGG